MDVDYAVGVSGDEERRHHKQESGQNNQVDSTAFEQCGHGRFIVDAGFWHDHGLHSQRGGAAEHAGFSAVAHHKRHFCTLSMLMEIADDVFGVRAVA